MKYIVTVHRKGVYTDWLYNTLSKSYLILIRLCYFFSSLLLVELQRKHVITHKMICMQKQMGTAQSQHIKLVMECILIKYRKRGKIFDSFHFVCVFCFSPLNSNQTITVQSIFMHLHWDFESFYGFSSSFFVGVTLSMFFLFVNFILKNICSGHKRSRRNEQSER